MFQEPLPSGHLCSFLAWTPAFSVDVASRRRPSGNRARGDVGKFADASPESSIGLVEAQISDHGWRSLFELVEPRQ